MAEPARKTPTRESRTPGHEASDEKPSGIPVLQRWVERAGGCMELLELPLTPELFLDPQLEDKMVQGSIHSRTVYMLQERLTRHFQNEKDIFVTSDLKHLLGPGLPGPAPDISIVRGWREPDLGVESYDLRETGIPPCLVIEVISPSDARLRRTDEVDKVNLYQRVGVREYLLLDTPRRSNGHRYRWRGYRSAPEGRYRSIEPDLEGRLVSETTNLAFGVSAEGDEVEIFDLSSGNRLRSPLEEEQARLAAEAAKEREAEARLAAEAANKREKEARLAAEATAEREKEAREAAERELAQLRAEIERLKQSGR